MRIQEEVMRHKPVMEIASWSCDFCGKVVKDKKEFPNDGFEFRYRPSEEDEIIVLAMDMCDECFLQEDRLGNNRINEALPALVALMKQIAPHAQVTARMWGLGDEEVEE